MEQYIDIRIERGDISYVIIVNYDSRKKKYLLMYLKQNQVEFLSKEERYFKDIDTAISEALQLAAKIHQIKKEQLPINSFEDLRQAYQMQEELLEIRKEIFVSYEKEYQKPLNRTTWSRWMNGKLEPNAVQKNIIKSAINHFYGRSEI